MKYDTEQMTFIGTAGTAEESAALALHYEIMAAAQTAAASLLDLARKIKRMRDTSGYKALGFDSQPSMPLALWAGPSWTPRWRTPRSWPS